MSIEKVYFRNPGIPVQHQKTTRRISGEWLSIQHGWDREIRTPEMTGSEPVALPLGYIPMRRYYFTATFFFCKRILSDSATIRAGFCLNHNTGAFRFFSREFDSSKKWSISIQRLTALFF